MGTIRAGMGRQVDLDDLTDSTGVAAILGLAQRNTVSSYRRRYPDFPAPVLDLGPGRCVLWLRTEIQAWREQHPPRGR